MAAARPTHPDWDPAGALRAVSGPLQEAKDLLAAVQDTVVEHQVSTALCAQVACPDCGIPRRHKGQPAHRGARLYPDFTHTTDQEHLAA